MGKYAWCKIPSNIGLSLGVIDSVPMHVLISRPSAHPDAEVEMD